MAGSGAPDRDYGPRMLSPDDGPDRTRILVADAHALLRESIRIAIEGEPDLVVVAEAQDASAALSEALRSRPDVAIVQADLPGDGVAVARTLTIDLPGCSVLVLCGEEDVGVLVRAMEVGAAGFLTKGAPLHDLVDAVRAVRRGEGVVPPRLLRALVSQLAGRRTARDQALRLLGRLTKREREVLALLATGADNDEISRSLVISPETARTHVHNLLPKIGVHSRLEAATFVIQRGVMDDLVASES